MKNDNSKMSDLTAAAILIGGFGIILYISFGTIPLAVTIGAGATIISGSIRLCMEGKKDE